MDRKLSALSPILALISVVFVSFSASADQAQDQTAQATQTFETMLKQDLYPLEREMVGFHWEQQNNGWEPNSLADIQRHLLNWSSHFFDPNGSYDNVGQGVYLATDPLVTRGYGGTDDTAELYVVTMKQGAKMLNATRTLTDAEIQAANKIFTDLSCGQMVVQADKIHTFTDILENTFVNFNMGTACKPIVQQVMKDLGVEAILYTYAAAFLPHCRDYSYAVNIISPNAIKAEDMAFYDGKFLLEGKPMAGMVRRAWEEASKYDVSITPYLADGASLLPPTVRSAADVADAAYETWKGNVYRCGPTWTGENARTNIDNVNETIRMQYSDSELHDLQVQLAKVARGRALYMQYYYLKQLSELSYKASGWAPDMSKFEQWRQAYAKMTDVYSTNGLIEIERLLEEPTTIAPNQVTQEVLNTVSNTFSRKDGTNPAVVFLALRKAGMGPRLVRMFGNLLITADGGAPFLGELPADLSTPIADTIKANREQTKDALRACLKLYNDSSVTQEQINAASCGMNQ